MIQRREHMVELARVSRSQRVTRLATHVAIVLLLCAGYYVGGIIGIALRFPPSGIATIWIPTAILLAVLLLTPGRTWWWYLLAIVPTHLHLVHHFQPGVPLVVALCQVGSNALHSVLAAIVVRRLLGSPPRFETLKAMAVYILVAAIGATAVACAVAALLFVLTGWASDFWLAFRQRVLANVFAILTIPPLIVLTVSGEIVGNATPRRPRYVELGLLTTGLLIVGFAVFAGRTPASANMATLVLAPLPLLLWAAVRLGLGGLCFSLLVVAAVSLSNAFAGHGPFLTQSPAANTLSLQIFLLAISVPLMILTAIVQERRLAQETALREREELAHVQRVATLGELTASIAHEINQPLTGIMANVAAARHLLGHVRTNTGPVDEALADIADDAKRAALVIQRLRALFLKEHHERITVDINKLIDEVLGLLHAEVARRHITIRFAPDATLSRVIGDPVQLQQVVLNLLVNACDAIDDAHNGQRVIVVETSHPHSGRLAIAVRDSGIGVEPADLERIFEHFVSSKPQGLGMGLAISRSIIQAHDGRIWATRNADVGTTMHIELPGCADQISIPSSGQHLTS